MNNRRGLYVKKKTTIAMGFTLAVTLILTMLVSGCSWLGPNVSRYESDEEISVPAGTYTTLIVENRAGTIRIKNNTGDRVTGLLRKKTSGSGASTLKTVAGAVTYQVQGSSGTLKITEVYRTDDRVDFWTWKDANHPDVNVGLEYELSVPVGVKVVEIRQAAGNTVFEAYAGTVSIANNAGNVTMTGARLTGDSRIALVSGNLDMGVSTLAADASLTAELTAGSISLTMPKNMGALLQASVGAGTISGNFDPLPITNSSLKQTLGNGGPPVIILVTSGNINLTRN
jgi:hypothetical protein